MIHGKFFLICFFKPWKHLEQFKEVTSNQTIDQQAMTFLRAFVADFSGKFEEVLKLAEEFRSYCKHDPKGIQELDEFEGSSSRNYKCPSRSHCLKHFRFL